MRRRDLLAAMALLGLSACAGPLQPPRPAPPDAPEPDVTPEEEHYLGRAVAGRILARHPARDLAPVNAYLNALGQTLAAASDRPQTYGGYSFLLLDAAVWNAYAAPDGFIFVTRGLLAGCADEDQLAAVLAHEVAHVQARHGLAATRRSLALGLSPQYAAREGGGGRGGALGPDGRGPRTPDRPSLADIKDRIDRLGSWRLLDLRDRTRLFDQMVNDITDVVLQNGYAMAQERQADAAALDLLARVGYRPEALAAFLAACDRRLAEGRQDRIVTHPSPRERVRDIRSLLGPAEPGALPEARRIRFEQIRALLG